MRGAIRRFIEATTSYKVCDAVDNDESAIHKARENHCDLILLHLTTPLQDGLVTASVLRDKLPHVKIVGFSSLSRAFVVITTDPGKSREIARQVASLPGVRMADPCWGSPDVLAVIEFRESQTLDKLVMDKIQGLEGVKETNTYIAIE